MAKESTSRGPAGETALPRWKTTMSALLDRRDFLSAFLRSFRARKRDGITWLDHDSFLVETGGLSCSGHRQCDGGWFLDITVWRITRIMPGMEEVMRMNPTPALRHRLLAAGVRTEFTEIDVFQSLVGQMSARTTPEELLRRMRKVCRASSVMDLGCSIPEIRQRPRR